MHSVMGQTLFILNLASMSFVKEKTIEKTIERVRSREREAAHVSRLEKRKKGYFFLPLC